MDKDNVEKEKSQEGRQGTDQQVKESSGTDKAEESEVQKTNGQKTNDQKTKPDFGFRKQKKLSSDKKSIDKTESNGAITDKFPVRKILIIAAVVLAAILAVLIYVYSLSQKQIITVVTTIGNLTFTDKQKTDEDYTITFQAADYNFLPEEMNTKGITTHISSEIYDAIALDTEYRYANILFEVPRNVARKAGFDKEKANTQALWTPEILQKYSKIQTAVWTR